MRQIYHSVKIGFPISSSNIPTSKLLLARELNPVGFKVPYQRYHKNWFEAFCKEVLEDPEVFLENVCNMDESGFSTRAIKAGCVIIKAHIHEQLPAQLGQQSG
jgi:hypothetical protein